jgi:FlgD Ig-like domain
LVQIRGRAAAVAISVGLSIGFGASAPVAGSADTQSTNRAGKTADPPAVPIDASGITFHAIRSGDLPIVPGQPFFLEVIKMVPTGPMYFAEVVNGAEVFIGAPDFQDGGTIGGVTQRIADWVIEAPTQGTHIYRAVFAPVDDLDGLQLTLEVVVQKVQMTLNIVSSDNPVQTHHQFGLNIEIEGAGTGSALTGQFEWRNADTGNVIATRSADDYLLVYSSRPVGTYRYSVRYTGDPERAAATSPVFTLIVSPDAVEVSGIAVQYPKVYPVKDGYRDTLWIRGTRLEPLTVTIRIHDRSGALVRTASFATGTGGYSYTWNGRNAAGTVLPAGQYKVSQTFTDAFSTKKTVTTFVYLSHEKLVTKTAYITRNGSSLSASGSGGGGSVTVSTTGGYAKLVAGSGWADAGWEFYIPGAVVYKSVAIEINAKAGLSAPPTSLGIQDFQRCPRTSEWNEACFDRWVAVGDRAMSQRWYATPGSSSSAYRSGHYVRGLIAVEYGTVYVYKARATVVYQAFEDTWGRMVAQR